jgi:hypothetical protein
MKHAVHTAIKISYNITQIQVLQGIFVSKYLIMNIHLIKNVPNAK